MPGFYSSIFDTQLLTFQRSGESYIDENGDLQIDPKGRPFKARGDLQPMNTKLKKQLESPTGFTLQDAKYFSSKADLKTMEEVGNTAADTTTIAGRTYYVWAKADWSGGPLSTDAYKDYYLVMQRRPNEGAF